jgi:hypothetical protein
MFLVKIKIMELSTEFKNLYRHWESHSFVEKNALQPEAVCKDSKLWEELLWFISERIAIWENKELGKHPYTTDPILSKYRFCNIFREFDRQTIEFHSLLNPLRDDFPLWLLNMFYCRMVARPETIKSVGLLSFDIEQNTPLYKHLMDHPRPRFGTPYVFPVSVIMKTDTPTRELFITQYLPQVMHKVAQEIGLWNKQSVSEGLSKVIPKFGHNLNFLWTEVLIDVAYQFPQYIDLYKQFPIGPGSIPTMQRINKEIESSELVVKLFETTVDTGITYEGRPLRLSAENWEGIGCEFRKYTNLKQGKGRKRLYRSIQPI